MEPNEDLKFILVESWFKIWLPGGIESRLAIKF
jgi:hypothetical protein